MEKKDSYLVNFSLKGSASMQIGIYFLLAAYVLQTIFTGFLKDDSPFGLMSVELIEIFSLTVLILTFVLSGLALYFKGRRDAKRFNVKLWNAKTKKIFWSIFISFLGILTLFIVMMKLGYINFIAPVFLLFYGLLLFFVKNKLRKNIVMISYASFLLAILSFFIPNYWYSSLFILGLAHITYGIVVKD